MFKVFKSLDDLLRGKRIGDMTVGDDPLIEIPLRTFVPLAIGLGATYGFFMGWYRVAMWWGQDVSDGYLQTLSSMIKIPALFLLTLAVTFPSLYVFSALLGGRLRFGSLLRLLLGTTVVSLTVAASFGPILAFFTLSTTSYPFMVILNVALLAISGFVGLGFLIKALRRLSPPLTPPAPPTSAPAAANSHPTSADEGSTLIFAVWILIYGAVGVQMAWLLRPFIGHPSVPFSWFRLRVDNFLVGLFENLRNLVGN
ncbi:MAG: hypothetical protein KF745_04720 [Phycisphaeraceae bacterium]|nr:hypothetical protein [Phycisphaeraceae bacterium]